ncbi:MAG: GNAT family N-acetyltransferase [Mycobacteriales bacterium]
MAVAATYPLRQRVLRPHQRVDEIRQPTDDEPDTAVFAAVAADDSGSDQVVATANVRPEQCPWLPDRPESWRLRGMATEPAWRGQGLGTSVLNAALAHVAMAGGGLIWCNARTPALSLYRRAGFVAYGEEWEEPGIGPHVRMWREVAEPLD